MGHHKLHAAAVAAAITRRSDFLYKPLLLLQLNIVPIKCSPTTAGAETQHKFNQAFC